MLGKTTDWATRSVYLTLNFDTIHRTLLWRTGHRGTSALEQRSLSHCVEHAEKTTLCRPGFHFCVSLSLCLTRTVVEKTLSLAWRQGACRNDFLIFPSPGKHLKTPSKELIRARQLADGSSTWSCLFMPVHGRVDQISTSSPRAHLTFLT
jgi:hypothetical protein